MVFQACGAECGHDVVEVEIKRKHESEGKVGNLISDKT